MRYYINKRTGCAAMQARRGLPFLVFSEVDGKKDFNRVMSAFDSEIFLHDMDTRRVSAIEAETYVLLQGPNFTPAVGDPLAVEAMADWRSSIDDDTIEAIMSDPNWREAWLDPETVQTALETAINDYPQIAASIRECNYHLSDADTLRLLVATRSLEITREEDENHDQGSDEARAT